MTQSTLFGVAEPTWKIETRPVARKDFDAQRAEAHKQAGMTAATVYRKALLERAQAIARKLASDGRSITADCVYEALILGSDDPAMLGPAAGSIFRGSEWTCVGWATSHRVSNHGRSIRIWRLK
jgi:hypothetical protein